MKTTQEQRKQKAVELMQKLDIFKPYIEGFKLEGWTCMFEMYGGYWTHQYDELEAKIKEIEEKYGLTVYAVTHDLTECGEMYSMLIVPQDDEDWDDLVEDTIKDNTFYIYSYVWNKDIEEFSEFGTICVESEFGGIQRVE